MVQETMESSNKYKYSAYNIEKKGCSEAELKSLYLLNNMSGMFSDKLLKLYEYFGSYECAYNADIREYTEAGLIVRDSAKAAFEELKKREMQLLKRAESFDKMGIRLISMFDAAYPTRLDNIKDKPPLLYVRGNMPADNRHTAAIVGARKCSEYGSTVAEIFARELAEGDVQVVSGLASGIDAAAAVGSLKGAGESYAVLGGGVNICYPRMNAALYDRMRKGEGGIISELPLDAPAIGYNFVLRNRIISGLSDVVIVIEAGRQSGTSITVGYALEQGREVYALPGRIDDPLGYGCNQFIKEGANIITEAADVLRYFEMQDARERGALPASDTGLSDAAMVGNAAIVSNATMAGNGAEHTGERRASLLASAPIGGITAQTDGRADSTDRIREHRLLALGDAERKVYSVLKLEPLHIEAIALSCGLSTQDTIETLMSLEAEGLVSSPRQAHYMLQCSARSCTSLSVLSQPMQASVMDLP